MKFQNFWEEFKVIRWKPILVPPEHGIWGFTIEAALLGFSFSYDQNVIFSLGIVFLMFLNPFFKQAIKIYFQDVYHKRTFLRRYIALFVCAIFVFIYFIILYSIYKNSLYSFWIGIGIGMVLGLILVLLEIIGYYQNTFLEFVGSMIPSFFAISMNSILEYQEDVIYFMFLVLLYRNFSSIFLTKEIVSILKNRSDNKNSFWFIAFFHVLIALVLYFYYFISFKIFMILLLHLLSIVFLYFLATKNIIKKPQGIGWSQIVLGIAYIVFIIFLKD
ncbi:MAG: hypothetical protein ACK4UJ_08620 [Leptonema sp. (in: bacteria)]